MKTVTESGLPILHQAIMDRDLDRVQELIEEGADVNQLDPKMGNAPLHIAAQCDDARFIELLLKAGAFVNLQTPRAGHTPLMVATWYSKPDNIQALLKAADINLYARTPYGGAMARDMIGGWDKHPDENDLRRNQEMEEILDAYEENLHARIETQKIYQTVIDTALSLSEKETQVAKLIQAGEPVNTESFVIGTGNDRHSPLLVAARENYPNMVQMLLDAGADIGQRGYMMNAIPFHKAGYMGNPEVMELLVNHPDAQNFINDPGPNNGYTPLHDAIWHGNAAAAKILIDAGADLSAKNYEGDTPLDLARRYQYQDIVEMILGKGA
ncbi:ankyrin repeat domain-containing protein [Pontibacter sp. G13]|uniref:ankyrin repeat domain-containing protein n=1 Tax=Pontibacter sp. G13 TaxID=3074898 RepID=UPI0039059D4A